MTRIDARRGTVIVGVREKEAVAARLGSEPDVVAAYLFGSQAQALAGPLSDVDLAVWLDPALPHGRRWKRQEELLVAAAEALGTDEVQVVVLNDAPPLLVHRVLRGGERLVDRDPARRVAFETAAIERYLETIPLLEAVGRGLARRMADGSYGRPRRD